MKPRRTFESVVKELIEGLDSGEIVLEQLQRAHEPEPQPVDETEKSANP